MGMDVCAGHSAIACLFQSTSASGPHLDLGRPPYVLYRVKYADLVSLALFPGVNEPRCKLLFQIKTNFKAEQCTSALRVCR